MNQKIDIVSFTGDSGLADYSVSLARALVPLAQPRLITAQSLPPQFCAMGFPVAKVFRRSRHYPLDIWRFMACVLARKPDWIIFQGPLKFAWLDALIVLVLRLGGVRCALTVHDVLPHYPKPWSRYTLGFYYRVFQRLITHSQAAAAGLQALGIRRIPLIVPHGIYDIFNIHHLEQRQARQLLGRPEDTRIWILFFGHLEPRKGVMEFLAAAKALADAPIAFVLAGSSSLQQHNPAYAQELDAARHWPNIILADSRIPFEAVEQYFAAADLVALPYLEGTTSGVLKLALAFGKPVVATAIGDFPEQIPPGAGIIFNAATPLTPALVAAIQTACGNLPQYTQAMQASRGRAEWPDIAASLLTFLQTPT